MLNQSTVLGFRAGVKGAAGGDAPGETCINVKVLRSEQCLAINHEARVEWTATPVCISTSREVWVGEGNNVT